MSLSYFQTIMNDTIPSIYPYPPTIVVKSALWYHPDADLFITIRGTVYGVYRQYFNVSRHFQRIFKRNEPGYNIARGTTCWLPIPFDDLDPFVFIKFLTCLYSPTTYDGDENDFKDIRRISVMWKFPELAGLALQHLLKRRQEKLALLTRNLCAATTMTSWIATETNRRNRRRIEET
jgi:hypothetical protein